MKINALAFLYKRPNPHAPHQAFLAMSDNKTSPPTPLELVYKHVDEIDVSMDVYVPERASESNPAPVLLWWHGKNAFLPAYPQYIDHFSGGGLLQVRAIAC
jgi:hypothetical protein